MGGEDLWEDRMERWGADWGGNSWRDLVQNMQQIWWPGGNTVRGDLEKAGREKGSEKADLWEEAKRIRLIIQWQDGN